MALRKTIITALSVLFISHLHAASPANAGQTRTNVHPDGQFINHKDWNFVENKGQLSDEKGNLLPGIKFYGHQGGVNLYCKPGTIGFVFTKMENEGNPVSEATGTEAVAGKIKEARPSRVTINRADLVLLNSNTGAQIVATDQQQYYENYFQSNTHEAGITHIRSYKTITYKDIYPHIDMVLHAKKEGMKYEFVVYPGGNVNDIRIQWNGLENMQMTENGGISYAMGLGTMDESKPVSYQGKNIISSAFSKAGTNVGFTLKGYDKTQTLVIDPSLTWATYFGGSSNDNSNAVATDASGNVYITGFTTSTSGIATSGAFLTSNAGSDAFLAKFNAAGAEQWATYYGGGGDVGTGVATDNSGNVFITGNTNSTSGIATSGAYQTSFGGTLDAFLAKFNSSGVRQWGTYYGGSGSDNGSGVATDGSGNVYITGKTGSSSSIASSGAYQTSIGGSTDAFLAKFNGSGTEQWATYYGGSGADVANGVSVTGTTDIYIVGSTTSKTAIATSGAYQTSQQGSDDVFLVKFNGSGTPQWGTYYGGNSADEGMGVAADGSGNVYITGYTGSGGGIATSGAYQTNASGGGTDGFIAGFNSSGARKWGSYYGGIGADFCYGIAADGSNNVYITGTTTSNRGGIVTTGAYQSSYLGSGDGFLAEFKNNGTIEVGTYYGGKLNDVGQGVAAFNAANVYLTGFTASDSGIATSGAFASSFAGGSNDAFLAKFNFLNTNDAGVVSVLSPSGTFCPGSQSVSVKIEDYGLVAVTKATINWSVNKIVQTPYSWTGSLAVGSTANVTIGNFNFPSGNDTIRAWTSKPNGITDSTTSNDSAFSVVIVNPLPSASVIPSTAICSGGSLSIGSTAISGDTYSWTSSPAGFTSTVANPSVSPTANTVYTLTEIITATGCTNTHSDTISLPVATPIANTTICSGTPVSLGETSYKGNIYSWTSSPAGFTSTLANPKVSPTVTTTYFFKDSVAGACSKSASVIITVNPLPAATVTANTSICSGSSISLGASGVVGNSYSWTSSPSGFSSTLANPSDNPTVNTVYSLTETITATGCSRTNSDTITLPSSIPVPNSTVCAGATFLLGGPAYPGHTYSWTSSPAGFSSTSSNPSIIALFTKTYKLKDSVAGCTKLSSVTITVNQLPQANVVSSSAICKGSVSLGGPSTGGHTYSWTSSPSGFTSTLSNPSAKPTVTTIYTLTETITSTGCSKSNSDTISLPHADVIGDTTICPGTSLSLGGIAYSGDSYTWTSTGSFGSTKANPTVTPTVTTTYYLTDAVGSGATGCTSSDSVVVTVATAPSATVLPSTAICSGNSVSLGTTAVGGHTYSWTSVPAGFTSTVSNPSVSPTVATAYTLTERITASGCTTIHSDTISLSSSTSVIASTAICTGTSISIGGKSYKGVNYSWTSKPSGFTSTIANPTVSPTITTTYYFKDSIAAGCKKTDSVTITVNPLPAAKTISNSTICSATPTQIGAAAVAGNQYSWTSSPKGFTSTSSNPYVSPTDTTTYYLTETITATGCSQSDSVLLTVNPLPAASVIPSTAICSGSISIGAASVPGDYYSWTSSTGFTSTFSNPSVTPTVTTIYTLTEEVLATGCSRINSDTISVPSGTTIANATICSGTSISLGGISYKGNIYSWTSTPSGFTSTSSNPSVSPTATTTYNYKDSASGCVKTGSVTITVNPLPAAKTITDSTICASTFVSLGGAAVPGSKYSWTSAPSGFSSTSSNPSVSPKDSTKYYLTETVTATGCSMADSVIIKVNTAPAASVLASTAICSGGSLSIGAASVSGDTYSWTSSPSGFSSTSSNPSVNPTATTIYTLTETITATGCSTIHSDTISLPTATVINDTAICSGSSISLGGIKYKGDTYSWTSSPSGFTSTLANPSVSPTITSKYYLKDSITGCSKIDSVTITVNPLPAASVIASTSICPSASISIGASSVAGDTYSWTSSPSGFSSTSSNPSVNPSSATTYSLTETISATGCQNVNSVNISINPLPSATVIANTAICPGGSISIGAAAISGDTYAWSSFPSGFTSTLANPSVSPTVITAYILTETVTATGCSNTNSDTVSVPGSTSIIASTAICSGSSIPIGGIAFPGNSYSWTSSPKGFSSTIVNPTVAPKTTTTYYLKDSVSGCQIIDSTTITVNPLPAASVIANTPDCSGSAISIGATAVPGDTYSWTSVPSGFTSTLANPSPSPTINTVYTLTETNTTTGCSKTNSDTITVPVASVAANNTICAGTSVTLGTGTSVKGHFYSWTSSPAGFTSSIPNPSLSPTVTTTYTLTDSVTGCNKKGSVTITVNPTPSATVLPSTAICSGNSVSIGATATSGNTYLWTSSPSGFISTVSNPSVSPTVRTVYTLTETITATGCSKTNSDTISLPASTSVIASTAICKGSSISVGGTANKGVTYSWTSKPIGFTSTLANPSVSPTITTKYYFKDTVSGCRKIDSVTITVNPLPAAGIIANTAICSGISVAIGKTAVTGSNYNWTSSPSGFSSTSSNPTVSPTITTTYRQTESIATTGCSKTDSVVITVNPLPSASVVPNTIICKGSSISIGTTAVSGDTYSWTSVPTGFTSTLSNPSVSPSVLTAYILTEKVTATGCSRSNTDTIAIPVLTHKGNFAICIGSSATIGGAAVKGNTYSWTSSPAGFTSTLSNPTISPTVTTKYYVKDSIPGCKILDSITVSINPLPSATVISNTTICSGSPISIGSSPTGGHTYLWTSSASGFTSTSSNPSVSPTSTTTYTLVESSATGCQNSGTVTITTNPLPSASSIIPNTAICSGGSISIGAAAVSGDTYSWTSFPSGFTSTLANPSVSITKTTVYILKEIITATGCTRTDSDTISIPAAVIHVDTTICAGTPVFIGEPGFKGNIYSWTSKPSGFTSTLANPSVSPTINTTYYFKDSVLNGCSKIDSVKIKVNPAPAAKTIANTGDCAATSISLGAGAVTGDKYSWASSPFGFSSTSSNPSVSPTKTTTYYLTETIAATGCSKTDTVIISVPSATVASAASICAGTSIAIGGTGYKTEFYKWSSSPKGFTSTIANPTVSPTVTTTYTLIDSISGCKKSASVTITVNPFPAAKLIASTSNCSGNSISIGAVAVSGDNYSWTSIPAGFTSTSSNPSVSPTATTIYILTETNKTSGCSKTNSDTIFLPVAPVAKDTTVCSGVAVSIGKNFTPLKGNSYSWTSSPAGFTSTILNPTVKPVVTTTYTFKDTLTGCKITNSVKVTVKPLPAASVIGSTALCSGSISIGAPIVAGDTYSWTSLPSGFTSTLSNPTVSPTATTIYYLTETNPSSGCSNTNSDTISFAASASILANTAVCTGSPTFIGGISYAGNHYSWTSSPVGFTSTLANPVASPTVNTTYYLKDSVASGCIKIDSVKLTVKPLPVAKTASNATVCSGSPIPIGAAPVTGSTYSWTSSPPGFTSTLSNPTASPKVTTTYYLTETASATGCSKTDSVIITTNPLPAASVIASTAICNGAFISIGANAVSGNKYSWTSSPVGFNSVLANPFVAPKVKTTYTLVDTLISTGCSNTNSVTITVNPLPAASTIASTAICSGNSISIGATAISGDTYSWTSSPSGFVSTISNPRVSPLKNTTYHLTEMISATGCSKSDSISISVNPLPAAPVIANTINCSGFKIFLGDSGVSGDTYSWSSSPAGFSSALPDPSDTPSVKTTYSLTETISATGCSKTNTVTVDINPIPAASVGTGTIVCAGTQVPLGDKAVTGDKYNWTSKPAGYSSTLSNPNAIPDTTTIYYLKETIAATGCYKIDSVEIFAKPQPNTNAGKDATICQGNFAPIGVAGVTGYKYSWTSSPLGFVSTFAAPAVSPNTTTTYILTDTLSSDKCIKIDSVTITVIPLPAAAKIKNTGICIGGSIAIGAAPVNNDTYSWTSSPAGFTSTISDPTVAPTVTTIYILTETSGVTGCSRTDSVTITVNPLPNAAVIPNSPVCFNSSILLGAKAVAGSKYSWTSSPSGFTSTLANPAASPTVKTTYYLTETITATGCKKKDSVDISINPQPAASVAANTAICPGTSVLIGASAVTGDTYSWVSSPKGFSSNSSNPSVTPSGTTTYTVTETITATGCSKDNITTVTVVPFPLAKVVPNQAICKGASVYLGTTGATGHTYSWTSSPSGFTSSLPDPNVSPTVSTTYTLTEINTQAGCQTTNSTTIALRPFPRAFAIKDTSICTGSSISIGAAADTGSTYAWTSSPSGFVSDQANPSVSPVTPTKYKLRETYNSTGCFNTDSVMIKLNPLPVAKVASSTGACPGGSSSTVVSIGAAPVAGDKYSWSSYPTGFSSTSSNPVANPTVTTTYTLTETIAATGCQMSNSMTISVFPVPANNAGSSENVCYDDSIVLGGKAVSGDTYSWTSNPAGYTSNKPNPIIFPTATTTYKLTETNSYGCSRTDSLTLTVNPLPDAHWTVITDNKGNASFQADSTKNKSYLWNFGNNFSSLISAPSTSYLKSGKYRVTLTTKNAYGCTGEFDSTITIHIHTSGIDEGDSQTFNLSLYPNPFREATTLQYNLNQSTRVTVELFDLTGKQIGIIEDNVKMEGEYSINIDAEKYHLTPGMYFLKFITNEGYVSRQIIKL